jgi:L-seryl-tRNA(Ser) seleniumtransferase
MKMTTKQRNLLRSLPAISTLLEHEEVQQWRSGLSQSAVTAALRQTLDDARRDILAGNTQEPINLEELIGQAESVLLELSTPSLRRVINATGVVLHTGLGRAPLSNAAIEAIAEAASG